MISRRRFLGAGSAATTLAVTSPVWAQRAPSADNRVPPSLASLTSMRDRVRPITADERRARLEKARRLLGEQGLDALLLCGGTSLRYFTGIRWGLSERLFAAVLPARGDAFLVCPAFEEDRAREQMEGGPLGDRQADVRTWEEHESPYDRVAQGLHDRGIRTGRLAVEETVRFAFSDEVRKAAPALTLASASAVTAGCRMVKDAHELELMRLASAVTLRAYEAAYLALAEGMTRNDFAALVSAAHEALGFAGGASVQVGEFAALPHGSTAAQTIRDGSLVLIDGGCEADGYQSDISRTFVLGRASTRIKEVFAVERRAQDAALAAAKPGVTCEAVDAAARRVIEDAGFGPGYRYFTHRVGHGIGMDGHEWPYLVRGNTLPLAPGMVFSDEPGIYLRGEFGVRLEDEMVITESGAELFTPQSASPERPFDSA